MLTIQGRLPSANELIRWDRIVGRNGPRKFFGSMKRRQLRSLIAGFIYISKVEEFKSAVDIDVSWYEPNAKRDYDNIGGGIKFILDALVVTRKIPGDSRRWIPRPVGHHFFVDRKNPRIEVTINEHHSMARSGVSRSA